MSGCAGVMSSQVAKPANPAPFSCIWPMARAGTSLARSVPNKSTKLIRKYLMPRSLATTERSSFMSPPPQFDPRDGDFVLLSAIVPRNPPGSRQRHTRHCRSLHGKRHHVLRFEVVHVALA